MGLECLSNGKEKLLAGNRSFCSCAGVPRYGCHIMRQRYEWGSFTDRVSLLDINNLA